MGDGRRKIARMDNFLYSCRMKVVTYSKLRQELAKCLDEVVDDHAPMLVTRSNGRHAVLMSLEDFASYEETRYLASSPENARRLREAIADADAGRNMIEVEFDAEAGEFKPKQPVRPASKSAA